MKTFHEAEIPQPILHRLDQMGFITPTPIQAQAIPAALEGRDILGSAQTGTGKTGAFGIPLIAHLLNSDVGSALVLLPTRELATQVLQALQTFTGRSKLGTALLIGGDPMFKQCRDLRNNPRILVGTPGRINDHLERGTLKLSNTNFLVLDEVDRMLDMGFGIQLDAIAKYLTSKQRQTLMFSATLPTNIKSLASKYLNDPLRISVGETHKPAANVKQSQIKVADAAKYDQLLSELEEREGSKIIFVRTKRSADKIADKLRKDGHKADALHGDLRQHKRTRVISQFKKEAFNVLVATDVAARGLDIPHIAHVVNFDLPQRAEDYIHRIGRTARAGAEGEAINFISPGERMLWNDIERLLDPSVKRMAGDRKKSGGGGGNSSKRKRSFKPNTGGSGRGKPSAGARKSAEGYRGRSKPDNNNKRRGK
ncbi:MAG: ATP-dependent RNA helicase [Legionellales bacterium]|nr:MAG: ATP-dependent RNA helicase [Legionellales bacterium]